jgi:transcriptional regulator with XRE-family HTH domain
MFTEEDQKILTHIGKKLAKLRKERGMTLRELADEIDSDNGWLSKIESGKKDIKVTTLVKLAKKLGVSVDYFL